MNTVTLLVFCTTVLCLQVTIGRAQENEVIDKPKKEEVAPESCTYTFQVTGTQLSRYCASVPSSNHHQIALLTQKIDAVTNDNAKLKTELAELKKKCEGSAEGVKKIIQETEAWRQIIHWPGGSDTVIDPGNLSTILAKEKEFTDCWQAYKSGNTKKGIYRLKPADAFDTFMAFCDEGWTVIQRRFNGKTSFNRDWDEYTMGFGELSGEFWLGTDRLHQITAQGDYELHFEGLSYSNKTYKQTYDSMKVGDEDSDYTLSIGNKTSGNYRDVLQKMNGLKFSAGRVDNDQWYRGNCARHYRTGWWLSNCGWSPNHEFCSGGTCMSWGKRAMRKTQLKIRPKDA